MIINLTQYLRPDGRKKAVTMEVPDSLKSKVDDITNMDLNFSCEVLTTGKVALYIKNDTIELDMAIELAENESGKNSPKNVLEKMIRDFDIQKAATTIKKYSKV